MANRHRGEIEVDIGGARRRLLRGSQASRIRSDFAVARGRDGRLGVAMCGVSAAANVIVHIATPDADSLRRSEAYITGQIARAVARGQRSF